MSTDTDFNLEKLWRVFWFNSFFYFQMEKFLTQGPFSSPPSKLSCWWFSLPRPAFKRLFFFFFFKVRQCQCLSTKPFTPPLVPLLPSGAPAPCPLMPGTGPPGGKMYLWHVGHPLLLAVGLLGVRVVDDDVLHQHGHASQNKWGKQVHVDVVSCAVEFSVQGENPEPSLRREWLRPTGVCLRHLCIYH